MIITLEKHGGFLPLRRKKIVDTTTLPREQAEEVQVIVAQVQASNSGAEVDVYACDAMTYEVKIKKNGKVVFEFTQMDGNISPAFSDLIKWISKHVAKKA